MLAGYTYNPDSTDPDTQAEAAVRQDGYLGGGRKPAEHVQKLYLSATDRPISVSSDWLAMIDAGIKILLSIKPGNPGNPADKEWLDVYLANLRSATKAAGTTADIILWQEPINDATFSSGANYIAYFKYYAPTVQKYFPTVWDPNFNYETYKQVASYYPGDASVDKIMVDSYSHSYHQSSTASPTWRWSDIVEPIADAASPPKPFGVAEWGWGQDATVADFNDYAAFIAQHFAARYAAGKPCADVLFFGSPDAPGGGPTTDIRAPRSFSTASVTRGSTKVADAGDSFTSADVGRLNPQRKRAGGHHDRLRRQRRACDHDRRGDQHVRPAIGHPRGLQGPRHPPSV